MRVQRRALLIVVVGLMLACNFPATLLQNPAASEPPSLATSTQSGQPATQPPSSTAAPTLTSTPSVPMVAPTSSNVNCRSGPDVAYDAVSALMLGQTAEIKGRNDDSSWWYIADPANPGQLCWVAASVVTTSGNLSGLPILGIPFAIATKVTVGVSIPSTIVCHGPNPLEFSGSITTNGAAKVSYQWEVGGDVSHTTSPETLNFSAAGTKDVSGPGALSVDCGNYSITLHVLKPNDISATKKFKVQP